MTGNLKIAGINLHVQQYNGYAWMKAPKAVQQGLMICKWTAEGAAAAQQPTPAMPPVSALVHAGQAPTAVHAVMQAVPVLAVVLSPQVSAALVALMLAALGKSVSSADVRPAGHARLWHAALARQGAAAAAGPRSKTTGR